MDQMMAETIVTLHPDVRFASQGTAALQRLMHHYAAKHPVAYWAGLVTSERWRYQRHEVIMSVAEQDWMSLTDAETALQFSELCVLAVEAVAAGWTPDQCRIAAVSINGKRTLSLICSLE